MAAILGRSAFVGVTPRVANKKVRFFPRRLPGFPSHDASDPRKCFLRLRIILAERFASGRAPRFPLTFPFYLLHYSGALHSTPRGNYPCGGRARSRCGNVWQVACRESGGVVLRFCNRGA